MPNWTDYFCGYTAGTSTSDGWINIPIPSVTYIQQDYEEYQRECERQDHIHEQILQEQAELAEDKKKYPLFFWRELCSKQRKENT